MTQAPSEQVRVGMVGLGLVANSHLKGYAGHPNAEVVAVCDIDKARAEDFARQHGIPQAYSSYDEMLGRAGIDVVSIATPNHLHAPMTLKAAKAVKHVHCEKPFSRYVGEGQAAAEAAREAGVKVVVGETYLFLSSFMKARELIEAGEIGRPLQVRQRHGSWLERSDRPPEAPGDRSWRVDPEKSGGGDYPWIYDHAVHFFTSAEYFMLDNRIAEVYAVVARDKRAEQRGGAAHDPYTTAAVDIPILTWKHEDPALQGLWARAERLNGKYDYMNGFSASIFGDKGMIEVLAEGGHNLLWDGQQVHLVLHREGKETVTFRFDEGGDDVWQSDISYYSQGHINQVRHLIDCIVGDTESRYDGEDGIHAVRCTLAAIMSAKEGRPVRIDEISPEYAAYR